MGKSFYIETLKEGGIDYYLTNNSTKKLKYKGKEKLRRRGIRSDWVHNRQAFGSSRFLSRRDHNSVKTVRSMLGDDHAVSLLHVLLNHMNGVNGFIADCVVSFRHRRNCVVYYDLGQVEVGISISHLFQAILKPVTIVNATRVKEGLKNTKLRHNVGFGFLHLLTKSSQLRCQIGLRFLHLLEPTGFLRKCLSLGCQLLVKGLNGLRVLSSLLDLNLLALTKPLNHPFIGHTLVLKGLHTH